MVASEKSLTSKELKKRTDGNEMDISMMGLTKVPVKEIAAVTKANTVDLSCNQLTILPDIFCNMLKHLIKLDLSKNQLKELPNDFGKLENLQHLDLYNNKLTILPVSFCHLHSLKWLDLKDNPLDAEFSKVVGDCLEDKQCRQCAINVVAAMKVVASNQERERQKMLTLRREKEAALKKEEQKLAEAKKMEKRLEKEQKRKQWMEQQRQQNANKTEGHVEELDVTQNNLETESVKKSAQSNVLGKGTLLMIFIIVLLAIGIGMFIYCQDESLQSNVNCEAFNQKLNDVNKILTKNILLQQFSKASAKFSKFVTYVVQLFMQKFIIISDKLLNMWQ